MSLLLWFIIGALLGAAAVTITVAVLDRSNIISVAKQALEHLGNKIKEIFHVKVGDIDINHIIDGKIPVKLEGLNEDGERVATFQVNAGSVQGIQKNDIYCMCDYV